MLALLYRSSLRRYISLWIGEERLSFTCELSCICVRILDCLVLVICVRAVDCLVLVGSAHPCGCSLVFVCVCVHGISEVCFMSILFDDFLFS